MGKRGPFYSRNWLFLQNTWFKGSPDRYEGTRITLGQNEEARSEWILRPLKPDSAIPARFEKGARNANAQACPINR